MNQEKSRKVCDLTVKENGCIEKSSARRRVFGATVTLLVLMFIAATAQPAAAESIVFPSGSGVINVKSAPYNATGNGTTDDTAAIQAAINDARGLHTGRTVYFPNGTYLVSNRLVMTEDFELHRSMTLQGQSQAGTIIKLADNTTAFGDPTTPRAVLTTWRANSSQVNNWQHSAFATNICNLTVDIGAGNPGAAGIVYIANNQGTMRDVTIRSSDATKRGFAGLDMAIQRIPGPALVKRVTIEGFDYGIRVLEAQYGMTFEHITLRNQRVVGVYNEAHVMTIRKLISENSVPAVRQRTGGYNTIGFSKGMIVLLDSTLTGGSAANPAIDLQSGFLFARNIQTTGYQAAIKNGGTIIPGADVVEWKTGETEKLFAGSPTKSMNLEVRETPELPWDNPANICTPAAVPCASGTWASVVAFGATQGDATDDTAAIQAALNSGATTVYFPNNTPGQVHYRVSGTLTVGGNVRRINGMYTQVNPQGALTSNGGAIFKFVDGNHPTVMLEAMQVGQGGGKQWFVEQASSKTLVLKNLLARRGFAYRNTGYGDVFIEDFHDIPLSYSTPAPPKGPSFVFKNQRVWARQINPEDCTPEIINDGATVWMLNLKTETAFTLVETKNGGRTEVLGGVGIIYDSTVSTVPAFINRDSHVSVVHAQYRSSSSWGYYPTLVEETRGGVTKQLLNTDAPSRPAAFDDSPSYVIPLYTGYVNAKTAADFDGDGRTDISIFRPAASVWHLLASNNNFAYSGVQFGVSTDKLAPADYDGDGTTDIALYRPSSGTWYVQQSGAGFRAVQWGVSSDKPVPADYDGDGRADTAVYRPATGEWYVYQSSDQQVRITQFGVAEDVPVVGDYDGDGRADTAVWRPSTGVWYVQQSGAGFVAQQFGLSADKPVAADYDGDGRTDMAVWRPGTGVWYQMKSSEGFGAAQFGVSSDVATPGDYDGDGRSDMAVWRPSTGVWYVQQSSAGFVAQQFGLSSDKAVPAAYVR